MDDRDPNNHPTSRALAALEKIIEGCKELATTMELCETEALQLESLTNDVLSLYDCYTDRVLVKAFEEGRAGDEPGVQGAKERLRRRLLEEIRKQPNLQPDDLKDLPTDGKVH